MLPRGLRFLTFRNWVEFRLSCGVLPVLLPSRVLLHRFPPPARDGRPRCSSRGGTARKFFIADSRHAERRVSGLTARGSARKISRFFRFHFVNYDQEDVDIRAVTRKFSLRARRLGIKRKVRSKPRTTARCEEEYGAECRIARVLANNRTKRTEGNAGRKLACMFIVLLRGTPETVARSRLKRPTHRHVSTQRREFPFPCRDMKFLPLQTFHRTFVYLSMLAYRRRTGR